MSILTCLIFACIAILIFVVYNAIAIHRFGVPSSLSSTFYLWNSVKENLGYIFTAMMFTMVFFLLPAWTTVNEVISTWSQYLTVLPFLGAASIAFVGTAPAYRGFKNENKVHMIAAACAAAFSLAWCAIVCYKIAWIILPLWVLIVAACAHLSKTHKTARDYWLEMIAFGATFTTIITECIMLL